MKNKPVAIVYQFLLFDLFVSRKILNDVIRSVYSKFITIPILFYASDNEIKYLIGLSG